MKTCFIIPHFEHIAALPAVLEGLEPFELLCIVVDDGSCAQSRQSLAELEQRYAWVQVVYRESNGGKGAALKTGYREAAALGFTHVLQVDADGQHDLCDVPAFLDAMRLDDEALVLGVPRFGESVPKARLYGRQLSVGVVWLATLSQAIPDPLCGFRGVPLGAALAVIDEADTGDRMDFDPEFAVRMHWQGTPILTVPTAVSYVAGGVSHFHLIEDNALLVSVYVRLLGGMLQRLPQWLLAPSRLSSGEHR